MTSFPFQWTWPTLLERQKELNGYSLAALFWHLHKRSLVPLASVVMFCSGLEPPRSKKAERQNIACAASEVLRPENRTYHQLLCMLPASTRRTIWWLYKELLRVKRKIVSLPSFSNSRSQPLQLGNRA